MVLELHVWGPALGLPSVDPECLGIITYFVYAVPKSRWHLVASSPSALPSHPLPALRDRDSGAWVSGFRPIVSYLGGISQSYNLDAYLTPSQRADTTAYAAFLATRAAPLVALLLYVSSANWAASTRPAYSRLLPFPLTWTEPPAIRAAMARRAEHLGLSSLDTDSELAPASAGAPGAPGAAPSADEAAGAFFIPPSLRRARRGVTAALAPEQAARIRLDAAARDCLSVLAALKGEGEGGRFFFSRTAAGRGDGVGGRPCSLDCLAFGYLALMLVPDVPRPWLAEAMRRHAPGLCAFVGDVREECFVGGWKTLLWVDDPASRSVVGVAGRLARSLLRDVPGVGGDEGGARGDAAALARAGCAGLVAVALAGGGYFLHRRLQPFGAPLHRWDAVRRGLGGFGAAGSFLGFTSEWLDAQYDPAGGLATPSVSPAAGGEGFDAGGGKPPVAEVGVAVDGSAP